MFLYVKGGELSSACSGHVVLGWGCVLSPYTKWENGLGGGGVGREKEGDIKGQRGRERKVF